MMKDIGRLMKQAQEMQRDLARAQKELGELQLVGESGGGLVTITLTGHHEVVDVHIDPQAVDPGALDLLEELVAAALRNVMEKIQTTSQEKLGMLGGLGGNLAGML
jgi:DNA-binding YbaB/EbfC family protein